MGALRGRLWRIRDKRAGAQDGSACDVRRASLSGFFLLVIATICLVYGLINLFHLGDVALGLFELGVLGIVIAAWLDLKRHGKVERSAWITVLASGALAIFFYWNVQAEVSAAVWVMFFTIINFFLLPIRQAVLVYLAYSAAIIALVLSYRADWPAVQTDAALVNVIGALAAFGVAAWFQEHSREAAHRKVQALANRDFLTGVWNRRHFIECAAVFQQQHRARQQPYAFLLADIDRFKRINDTYGHATGDEVLKAVVQRIVAAVRGDDMVGRLGGEEFGVLLGECDLLDARHRADAIRQAVAAEPISAGGERIPVTISLGVAGGEEAGHDFSELFSMADARLYMAKAQGRNRIVAEVDEVPTSA